MSDSTITPIGVATSAVAGAAAVAGATAIGKFAKAKFIQMPKDSFIKRTAKEAAKKARTAKETVPKTIREAYTTSKNAIASAFGATKNYIGSKLSALLNKPFMKTIGNFIKKPMVAGALIGAATYIIAGKIIDKIKEQ